MHTLTVEIQDSFIQDFLNFVNKQKDSIKIKVDENLKYDPYFYQRQKELHQLRDDIKNSKVKMVSHESIWSNIYKHIQDN